jgi:hypothetical protein
MRKKDSKYYDIGAFFFFVFIFLKMEIMLFDKKGHWYIENETTKWEHGNGNNREKFEGRRTGRY